MNISYRSISVIKGGQPYRSEKFLAEIHEESVDISNIVKSPDET